MDQVGHWLHQAVPDMAAGEQTQPISGRIIKMTMIMITMIMIMTTMIMMMMIEQYVLKIEL